MRAGEPTAGRGQSLTLPVRQYRARQRPPGQLYARRTPG